MPKNPFNKLPQLKDRIEQSIQDRKKIVFYLLLCPCYPNDGKNFTYVSGTLSSDPPPNLKRFIEKLKQNIAYLKHQGVPEKDIQITSLVCDIEYDLPTVLDRFAEGSKDKFLTIISKTAKNIGVVLNDELLDYPDISLSSETFLQHLPCLKEKQNAFEAYTSENELPQEFSDIRKKASGRTGMFENLYGAVTQEDKDKISLRQMINYFAVIRSLQEQNPGSIVINEKSPNTEFFQHPNICEILDTNKHSLPIFQILS